jgi:hypothetical protein
MFPFMHVFVPVFFCEIPQVRQRLGIQRFALIIGSMLPDLIDKPLSLFFNISGRGFGHTPFYLLLLFISLSQLTKNRTIISSLAVGSFFHLLLDIPAVPWFAPFVDYDFGLLADPLQGWWITLLTNPLVQITELVGFIGLIGIVLYHKLLFDFGKIKGFLWEISNQAEDSISINKKKSNLSLELKN